MQPIPRIWLGEDGIMRIECPQDYHLTLEDMQALNRQHREISVECRPVLAYGESVAAADHDAQLYASSDEVIEVISAMAIIVRSFFTRAIADIFMKFHKPPYPTRLFSNEADALVWLQAYCEQPNGASGEGGKRG
ncbi:hypothetical protein MNBD_GAMMA15-616 [hydrothermal vent metagenome]|uniref:DUF7793 domain-containing protein n=1 Tax=hydrothermal vent metagenome TaxID=652676 RepID=A0A3B0ZB09_9ZZZZ